MVFTLCFANAGGWPAEWTVNVMLLQCLVHSSKKFKSIMFCDCDKDRANAVDYS